ncbi:MAG: hypothetical protein QOJ09_787 [Actinomycetota bacterium]|nr:hypothetical protein [Actinomycetota bacterium]
MSPSGFVPTHVIPAGGLPAWAAPDPTQDIVATIEARVEVVVREERGAWADVLCSNGWSAWVDGRRLLAIGAGSPSYAQPQPAAGGYGAPVGGGAPGAAGPAQLDVATLKRLATPPVIGAVLLALGTILPWTRSGFGSGNGFDVPITFLWSKTAGSGGVKLGLLLLVLGAGGVYVASRADIQRFRIAVGGVAALCVVLFVVQFQRVLSGTHVSLTKVLGFGVLVTLVGAVALAVAPLQWPKRT